MEIDLANGKAITLRARFRKYFGQFDCKAEQLRSEQRGNAQPTQFKPAARNIAGSFSCARYCLQPVAG